jgi:hypothetical protein
LTILIILHLVSIILPIVMSLIDNSSVQHIIYWVLNIISPSINAQAIITYILAQKSKFCTVIVNSDFEFFKSIGNDTIGVNWVILFIHIIVLLLLLIAMDCGFLKFSFSFSFLSRPLPSDENMLDNDVLAERRRVLKLNPLAIGQNPVNVDNNEEGHDTDHLTVHDLVKRYPGRSVFAVNHLTFGAKRGEAFGLLGYNVSQTKIFFLEKI